MPVVCGCGLSFKPSGFQNHQRQSLDPRCNDRMDDKDSDFDSNNPHESSHDIIKDILEKQNPGGSVEKIDVDPTGDYFGDYIDCEMEVDSGLGTKNPVEELTTSDEEDSDEDSDDGLTLTMEIFEPERQPPSENQDDDSGGPGPEDSSAKEKATQLRGGAETELRKRPFIVKFPGGQAGAVYANQAVDDNLHASYTRKVGSAGSPFYPFSSKMEWEIAQWAKMRGPSSTAFTELMNIEGVSFFFPFMMV